MRKVSKSSLNLGAVEAAYRRADAPTLASLVEDARRSGNEQLFQLAERLGRDLLRIFGPYLSKNHKAWTNAFIDAELNNYDLLKRRREAGLAQMRKELGLAEQSNAGEVGGGTAKFTPSGRLRGWYREGQTRGLAARATPSTKAAYAWLAECNAGFGRLKFALGKSAAGAASGRSRGRLNRLIVKLEAALRSAGVPRRQVSKRVWQQLTREHGVQCTLRHIQQVIARKRKRMEHVN